jgi:AcrR family transcriptional regulator
MYEMQEQDSPLVTSLDDFWPPSGVTASRQRDSDRQQHRRRDKSLTRGEIVKTAVDLADSEGAAAVNMRRIAKELGAGAMSLYWYVADKDQLLDLMLDVIEGESKIAKLTGDWRSDFRRIAVQRRRALLGHPWAVEFMSGRDQLGPNALLLVEQSLSVFDGLNLDTRTALHILMTIDTYVTGSVLNELREIRVEETRANSGVGNDDFAPGLKAWIGRLRESGMFTHVVRVFEEGIDPDSSETRDVRFEFGLDCVLDGVAVHLR